MLNSNFYSELQGNLKSAQANLSNRFFFTKDNKQQVNTVALERQVDSALAQSINLRLWVASGTLLLAAIGQLYPSIMPLCLPGLLYLCMVFFQEGYQSLFIERRFRISVLDAIYIAGSLLYHYYFLTALAALFGLISRKLVLRTENSSQQELVNLFGEQPQSVRVQVDGVETEVPFEQLNKEDIVIVHAGEVIPVDGILVEGVGSIDQHKLTGEAQPAEKGIGDSVFATTVVLSGKIVIRAEKTGSETVAAQIGTILNRTTEIRTQIQTRAEAFADKTALPTFTLFMASFPFVGPNGALAILSNTFGYQMRIFGPISMLNYLNLATQHGILVKDGRSMELLSQVDTVVFDKTGTLTSEQPYVSAIYAWSTIDEDILLQYAAAAEKYQSHPIARAILAAAQKRDLPLPILEDAHYEVGYGIKVKLASKVVHVGSSRYMAMEGMILSAEMQAQQDASEQQGCALVYVALDEQVVGAIELHPTIRPEAKRIIQALGQRNLSTVIISGDRELPTQKLAHELGIGQYYAETLPEDKANLIAQLHEANKTVCFIGDGINDSIALKKADVSISLSGATTVAKDTAQIVLMDGSLNQLTAIFDLVDEFETNNKISFAISTLPSIVCLGGVYLLHWGLGQAIFISPITIIAGLYNTMHPLLGSRQEVAEATNN